MKQEARSFMAEQFTVNWLDDHINIIIHAEEMEDISLDLFYRQGE